MDNKLFRKVRSDASWKRLRPDARARLESWLCDENLSYAETVERAKVELGFVTSIWAMKRFRDRILEERFVSGLQHGEETDGWRESARRMISRVFVSRLGSEQGIELNTIAKWLAWSEANAARRQRVEIEDARLKMDEARMEGVRDLLKKAEQRVAEAAKDTGKGRS